MRLNREPVGIQVWGVAVGAEEGDDASVQEPAEIIGNGGFSRDENRALFEQVLWNVEFYSVIGSVDEFLPTWFLTSVDVNTLFNRGRRGVVNRADSAPEGNAAGEVVRI